MDAAQRDTEKIVACNAFSRLRGKTQVAMFPSNDHVTDRLTHTLKVAMAARRMARRLGLDEDLAEAMAVGHDLGHAPFGHLGESVLATLSPVGFTHSGQSVRVIKYLENDGRGLDVGQVVLDGIATHSKGAGDFMAEEGLEGISPEAQVLRLADALAYLSHDVPDAVRAGLLKQEDLPVEVAQALGHDASSWLTVMVDDVIDATIAATGGGNRQALDRPLKVVMSAPMAVAVMALRDYLFSTVYLPLNHTEPAYAARAVVETLYVYYSTHPGDIPWSHPDADPHRATLDYVSGMTDRFALTTAECLVPGIGAGVQSNTPVAS